VTRLLRSLRDRLGPGSVTEDAEAAHLTDWIGRTGGSVCGVVYPESTVAVAAALQTAAQFDVPVQVQGGNTGLAGGSTPSPYAQPALLVSLNRLVGITEVDEDAGRLTALAGTPLAEVQQAAAAAGWYYGVDLAARDSATIGGTVATNAGGIRVCAFGTTRDQLLGIEAVLADGSVVSDLQGFAKDNTGYDLASLLCGSEGTLGVITAVRVRLWPTPPLTTTVALPVPDLRSAAVTAARAALPGYPLLAAEVIDTTGWRGAAALAGIADPLANSSADYVLLLEVGDGGKAAGLAAVVTDSPGLIVAVDERDRRQLWALREQQSEYWSTQAGEPFKFDVSVPTGALDDLVEGVEQLAAGMSGRLGVFGHIREQNLHLQVNLPSGSITDPTDRVLQWVAELGGSISAEHGVGRDKAHYLSLRRSPAEIATMRAIKSAFDPHHRLNPGVLFTEDPTPE
jgi:FAD/FMN-containing dehydrogenase